MMDATSTPRPVRAIELRHLLTWYLHELGPLSVAELSTQLHGDGLRVYGRPSKEISDALRWEVRRVTRNQQTRALVRGHESWWHAVDVRRPPRYSQVRSNEISETTTPVGGARGVVNPCRTEVPRPVHPA